MDVKEPFIVVMRFEICPSGYLAATAIHKK